MKHKMKHVLAILLAFVFSVTPIFAGSLGTGIYVASAEESSSEENPTDESEPKEPSQVQPLDLNCSKVYLDGSAGDDSNDGQSADKPVKTWEKAYALLGVDGGKIVLVGSMTIDAVTNLPAHTGTVTITAVDDDANNTSYKGSDAGTADLIMAKTQESLIINGPTVIENLHYYISAGSGTTNKWPKTYILGNGHALTLGEGITCSRAKQSWTSVVGATISGTTGSETEPVNTNVTIKSGSWGYVTAGTISGTLYGDANLTITGGLVAAAATGVGQSDSAKLTDGTVYGDANLTITGGEIVMFIAPSHHGTIKGNSVITIDAADANALSLPKDSKSENSLYAASHHGKVEGSSTLNIQGYTKVEKPIYSIDNATNDAGTAEGDVYINISGNAQVTNGINGGSRVTAADKAGTINNVIITVSDNADVSGAPIADGNAKAAKIILKGGTIGAVTVGSATASNVAIDLSEAGSLTLKQPVTANTLTGGGDLTLVSGYSTLKVTDSVSGSTAVSLTGVPQTGVYLTVPTDDVPDDFTWANEGYSWSSALSGDSGEWTEWSLNAVSLDLTGVTFTRDDFYQSVDVLPGVPRTIESWIKVDEAAPDKNLGVIVSTFSDNTSSNASVFLMIRDGGHPTIAWRKGGSDVHSIAEFTSVDVRTGGWLHLAVTCSADTATCYVNGVAVQTVSIKAPDYAFTNIVLGNDLRNYSNYALQYTELNSVNIFSAVRSEAQIQQDMYQIDPEDEALIGSYNLGAEGNERLKDSSKYANHLYYRNTLDYDDNEFYGGNDLFSASEGISFDKADEYVSDEAVESIPMTFEASIYFPECTSPSEFGGNIVGNRGYNPPYTLMRVGIDGAPELLYCDEDKNYYTFTFDEVCVYTGQWMHVAIVRDDAAGMMHCYIDGELKQSLPLGGLSSTAASLSTLNVGLMHTATNRTQPRFKGSIRSVALYADARTADEVKADYTASLSTESFAPDKGELLVAYDLSESVADGGSYADLSGNGNDLNYMHNPYLISPEEKKDVLGYDDVSEVFDYAYSMAVIGDTQKVTVSDPDLLGLTYDWILDIAEEKNLKFVMGLGDITDVNKAYEWEAAVKAITKMDGKVPYSIIRGNHDKIPEFNQYFKGGYFDTQIVDGRYEEDSLTNTYTELIIEETGTKYLILCLDYTVTDGILEWANKVVAEHPEHNVIVNVHGYMHTTGPITRGVDSAPVSSTGYDGDEIWDKFVRKHENIIMVLSGHVSTDKIIHMEHVGDNGNKVVEILIDPQDDDKSVGPTGMVAMFYFSEDGRQIRVEYYSPIQGMYYQEANQFTMAIDPLKKAAEAPVGLTANHPTEQDGKGTIGGLNAEALYEYRLTGTTEYTKVAAGSTEIADLAAGTYEVRFAETDTHKASEAVSVTVKEWTAAPEGLTANHPTEQDGNGTIGGLNAEALYEYRLTGTTEYTKVAAGSTEIADLAAGTYEVRFAETDTHKASEAVSVTLKEWTAAPAGLTANHPTEQDGNGTIGGLNAEALYEYRLIGSTEYTKVAAGSTEIADLAAGTYEVRFAETDASQASEAVSVTVKEWTAAPAGLTANHPTEQGGNGTISGLNAEALYEYRLIGSTEYTKVAAGSTEIADLAAGTYEVRFAETDASQASEAVSVTVKEWTAAPTGLTANHPTKQDGKGTISGLKVEALYEYRLIGSTKYTKVAAGSTEIADLAAGTYEVRFAETDASQASEAVSVTIEEWKAAPSGGSSTPSEDTNTSQGSEGSGTPSEDTNTSQGNEGSGTPSEDTNTSQGSEVSGITGSDTGDDTPITAILLLMVAAAVVFCYAVYRKLRADRVSEG